MLAKLIPSALVFAMLVAVTPDVDAQGNYFPIQIPFSFSVGETFFEGGDFEVRKIDAQTVAVVKAHGRRTAAMVLTIPGGPRAGLARTGLLFTQYGDERFLSEVRWSPSEIRVVRRSAREEAAFSNQIAHGANIIQLMVDLKN